MDSQTQGNLCSAPVLDSSPVFLVFGTWIIRDFLSLRLVILHFHSILQVPQNGKVAIKIVKVCIYRTSFVDFLICSITVAVSYCTTVFQPESYFNGTSTIFFKIETSAVKTLILV